MIRKFEQAIKEKMKIYEAIDPLTGKEKVVNATAPAGTAPQTPASGTSAPAAPTATTAPTGGTPAPATATPAAGTPAPATGAAKPATPQVPAGKTDFTKLVNAQNLPDLLKYLTTDPTLSKGVADYVAKNQTTAPATQATAQVPKTAGV